MSRLLPHTRVYTVKAVPGSSTSANLLPHTRGYTGSPPAFRMAGRLAPAHAGLHRSSCSRTRGATPAGERLSSIVRALLPHTRGYTAARGALTANRHLAPAHAGLHRLRGSPGHPSPSCSRTRGGYTESAFAKLLFHVPAPACAGLHRGLAFSPACLNSRSRTRGTTPTLDGERNRVTTLLPHTRGYTGGRPYHRDRRGPASAHAGLHRLPIDLLPSLGTCSRTRGDTPSPRSRNCYFTFLLPHMRGYTGTDRHETTSALHAPARAGATLAISIARSHIVVLLPHMWGYIADRIAFALLITPAPAHAGATSWTRVFAGLLELSLPHTRGCTGVSRRQRHHRGFCSRTRGATLSLASRWTCTAHLLPHTRGYTGSSTRPCRLAALAPARAGLHRTCLPLRCHRPSCSRTRGAAPQPQTTRRPSNSLLPHARGCTAARHLPVVSSVTCSRRRGAAPQLG